jgi:hypothetical protein
MMSCMMPMLRWYTTRFRLDPRELPASAPGYGDASRYLLPGEWQACAPHVDAIELDLGLFVALHVLHRHAHVAGARHAVG